MVRIAPLLATLILTVSSISNAQVKFGIDVLRDDHYKLLAGKRVGLVANPASVDQNLTSTADLFKQQKVFTLVSLFGPEHGIHGDQYAGDKIEDRRDPDLGIPIYSVYGKTRKPTTQSVLPLQALVFDLQDIGSRSYTYISTMKMCMEACRQFKIELVILDRPNPLGGNRVEGPGLVKKYESFVGLLPVPYVHGMTMGELAQLTRDQVYPDFKKLTIVRMTGWNRDMTWKDTGRDWVPTSPHIPTSRAVAGYIATGILGELYVINIGVGYTLPFEMIGAPWITGDALAGVLPPMKGVTFRSVHFKPFYGTFKTEPCQGLQIHVDLKDTENLVEINYRLIEKLGAPMLFAAADRKAKAEAEAAAKTAAEKAIKEGKTPKRGPLKWDRRTDMFDKVSGSDEPRKWLNEGRDLAPLFAKWRKQCDEFRDARKKYLHY